MRRYDFWKLSVLNILSSPIRSALTVLGMAIGIGAILAVLTLGAAGKSQVESEMSRLGIDRVWLSAGESGELRPDDADMLARALRTTVTGQVYAPISARFGDRCADTYLVGCTPEYLRVMDTSLVSGRLLCALEWQPDGRAALMGEGLARELRARPGDTVSLSGYPFRLAGVVRQLNELSQVDASRAVFIPASAYCELMGQTVHEITICVPDGMKPQTMAAMAYDVMLTDRGARVETLTMQVQIEAANSVVAIFVDVLKWVAFICILVGGIGVMNILLVSVRERKREIGVMQSLGATRPQVCLMFLLEALIYALAGGALGLITGFGLIYIAGSAIGLTPGVRLSDCALTFGCALAVGLFFGVLPARRASGMKPVDALRED